MLTQALRFHAFFFSLETLVILISVFCICCIYANLQLHTPIIFLRYFLIKSFVDFTCVDNTLSRTSTEKKANEFGRTFLFLLFFH